MKCLFAVFSLCVVPWPLAWPSLCCLVFPCIALAGLIIPPSWLVGLGLGLGVSLELELGLGLIVFFCLVICLVLRVSVRLRGKVGESVRVDSIKLSCDFLFYHEHHAY